MATLRELEEKFPQGLAFLKKKDFSSFFVEGFDLKLFDNVPRLQFYLVIWNRRLTVRELRTGNETKDKVAASVYCLSYFKMSDQEIDSLREGMRNYSSHHSTSAFMALNIEILKLFDRFEIQEREEPLPDQRLINVKEAIVLLDQGEWAVKVFDNVMELRYEVVFWHRGKLAGPHILPIYYQKIDSRVVKKFTTKGKMNDPLHTWHTSGLLRELILAFGGPVKST